MVKKIIQLKRVKIFMLLTQILKVVIIQTFFYFNIIMTNNNNESFSGEYWIDPNEGDVRDAVLVRCDVITKSTCIIPQPDHIGPIDFGNRRPQPEIWLSEFENIAKVVNISIIIT